MRFKVISVLLFTNTQLLIDSDFDDHHDSPKEEVNRNNFVHYSDISDIFKDSVDDNGVSSCLKSLWKTRLCKFHLNVLTSSQSLLLIVGQSH